MPAQIRGTEKLTRRVFRRQQGEGGTLQGAAVAQDSVTKEPVGGAAGWLFVSLFVDTSEAL